MDRYSCRIKKGETYLDAPMRGKKRDGSNERKKIFVLAIALCDFMSIINIEMCDFYNEQYIEMCKFLRVDSAEKCGGALC